MMIVFILTKLKVVSDLRLQLSVLFVVMLVAISSFGQKAVLTPVRKVLFVIVDGIPADVIEKVPTPALDVIAKEGKYLAAFVGGKKGGYNQTPTISAVGYNSLLTGTWANKHNVWDNDIAKPNYHYYTIFKLLKDQYPGKKIGVFSSWLDNRTKLVGDGLIATNKLKVDFSYDGLEKDTISFPHDAKKVYMHLIDEAVVKHAAGIIRNQAPDLNWVYLEYTDDVAHMSGDGEAFSHAVQMADDQIKQLWDAVKLREKNYGEQWQVYITTDHGRDSVTGRGHGHQSNRERNTWIVTNAKDINPYFIKNKPAIVDIMPSIARFMNLRIPPDHAMELDGVPITGQVSVVNPSAVLTDSLIELSWTAIKKTGSAKVWISTTNNYRLGQKDNYVLAGIVPVNAQRMTISRSKFSSEFYKMVIEAESNFANCWAGHDLDAMIKTYK